MKGSTVRLVGGVLLGLLLLSAVALTFARREAGAFPSATSYGPSGLRAFVELLHRNDISTRVEVRQNPRLGPSDLAVAFFLEPRIPGETGAEGEEAIRRALREHVSAGGTALSAVVAPNFRAATMMVTDNPHTVTRGPESRLVTAGYVSISTPPFVSVGQAPVWFEGGATHFAVAYPQGQGVGIHIRDGILATNRFIGQHENAAVLLDLVRSLKQEGGAVVFLEAAFGGGSAPGLLETIGAWAPVMWMQVLFLFAVIAYTLGKRFGLAEQDRPPQRGARELVDAVAMLYQRARATDLALSKLIRDTERDLRAHLKLPAEAPESMLLMALPESLRTALAEARAAVEDEVRTPPREALRLGGRIQREADSFIAGEAGAEGRLLGSGRTRRISARSRAASRSGRVIH
jgi:hypothetical protein